MKYHAITKTLTKIHPELACIWNPVIERWQIYQRKQSNFVLLSGNNYRGLRLLWTCENQRGDYLEPGQADLHRAVRVIEDSRQLWNGDVDKICDDAEDYEAKKERELAPAAQEAIREIAEAAAWSVRRYGEIR